MTPIPPSPSTTIDHCQHQQSPTITIHHHHHHHLPRCAARNQRRPRSAPARWPPPPPPPRAPPTRRRDVASRSPGTNRRGRGHSTRPAVIRVPETAWSRGRHPAMQAACDGRWGWAVRGGEAYAAPARSFDRPPLNDPPCTSRSRIDAAARRRGGRCEFRPPLTKHV